MKLKSLLTEIKYDYGCVMAQMPQTISVSLFEFGKQVISDDMLYFDPNSPGEFGREKEFHVTIKFGLTNSYTTEQIQEMLKGTKPFLVNILGMDIFPNERFDVIKFNIEGEELRRLRKIFDVLPNKDDYKEYHPHMTLAYVQPGLGARFQGKSTRNYSRVLVSSIKYSDRGKGSFYRLC